MVVVLLVPLFLFGDYRHLPPARTSPGLLLLFVAVVGWRRLVVRFGGGPRAALRGLLGTAVESHETSLSVKIKIYHCLKQNVSVVDSGSCGRGVVDSVVPYVMDK